MTVLYGGDAASGPRVGDTWEWTGASWRRLAEADPEGDGGPGRRKRHALAYDSHHDALVLVGGTTVPGIWHGRNGAKARPAHIARFDLWAMRNCYGYWLNQVSIHWRGGATGDAEAANPHGALLLIRDEGVWKQVASSDAPALGPASMTAYSTSDLDRRLHGDYDEIAFALVPKQPNGLGRAVVTTDYVELVARYTVPDTAPARCE